MKIVFTSKNAAKVRAVRQFLKRIFGNNFELLCFQTEPNVSATPFSNEECLQGARNRIAFVKQLITDADFYIGAEGGVFPLGNTLMLGGWVVVEDKNGREYIGSSCFLPLPNDLANRLTPQVRLSEIIDETRFSPELLAKSDELGTNGLLTNGKYTRVMEFEDALHVAFSQAQV
ncbi:MAG TPA: inosine/xanthosine triphosphatase [Candidatus Saccharimonadales bacterium]|nr:inosine/xanthosine triphosphatase [Candidatus Saccharimonadales bacterium]